MNRTYVTAGTIGALAIAWMAGGTASSTATGRSADSDDVRPAVALLREVKSMLAESEISTGVLRDDRRVADVEIPESASEPIRIGANGPGMIHSLIMHGGALKVRDAGGVMSTVLRHSGDEGAGSQQFHFGAAVTFPVFVEHGGDGAWFTVVYSDRLTGG